MTNENSDNTRTIQKKALPKISIIISIALGIAVLISYNTVKGIFSSTLFRYAIYEIYSHFYIAIIDLLLIILITLILRKSRFLFLLINLTGIFSILGFYYISVLSYNSGLLGPLIFHFAYTAGFIFIVGLIWMGLYIYFKFAKKNGSINFE